MKWTDGLTRNEKIRRRENWHTVFALFPHCVYITADHHKVYVWLEAIERKGTFNFGCDSFRTYEYREIPHQSGRE